MESQLDWHRASLICKYLTYASDVTQPLRVVSGDRAKDVPKPGVPCGDEEVKGRYAQTLNMVLDAQRLAFWDKFFSESGKTKEELLLQLYNFKRRPKLTNTDTSNTQSRENQKYIYTGKSAGAKDDMAIGALMAMHFSVQLHEGRHVQVVRMMQPSARAPQFNDFMWRSACNPPQPWVRVS